MNLNNTECLIVCVYLYIYLSTNNELLSIVKIEKIYEKVEVFPGVKRIQFDLFKKMILHVS